MLHVPSRDFIVVAHPRTGTNFLCNMIADCLDVRYLGEYFPNQDAGHYNIIEELFYGEPTNLYWTYDLPEVPRSKGQFAKLFYYLFVWPIENGRHDVRWDLLDYIKTERINVIHMKRWNILDTVISHIRSTEEKNYISEPYKEPKEIPVDIIAHLLWLVNLQMRAMDDALKATGVRHVEVWYDDMVKHPQNTADMVAEFLHRPRMKIVPDNMISRQRRGSQRDNVLNYDELKKCFSRHEFKVFFED